MTQPTGQQPQQPQAVQPQPLPTTISVDSVTTNDGRRLVLIRIDTFTGSHFTFLTPAEAKTIAATIERVASQAQTGLILPGGFAQ